MSLSKNEIREKRGKIACLIIFGLVVIFMIGSYFWICSIGSQFENSLTEKSKNTLRTQSNLHFEIKEGRLVLNLFDFQSFYGLPDSLVRKGQDTINYYIKKAKEKGESYEEIETYLFLEDQGLLFTPCQFLIFEEKKARVYFSETDMEKIQRTDWVNKNKFEKKHTFIKMKIKSLTESIFLCEEILGIEQRAFASEE